MIGLRIGLISPVFPYPRPGIYPGIERHAVELARHLTRRGHHVTIFTTFWNGGSDGDSFEGMPIHRASDLTQAVGRVGALFDLHYVTWGRALLKHRETLGSCDIIHSLAPLSSARTLTSMGIPLVTHFHHYEAVVRVRDVAHKPFHHRLEGFAYKNSTLVVSLSSHSAKNLEAFFRIPRQRIRTIPDGVDLNLFSPRDGKPSQPPLILHVGQHVRRKGLEYLLQALLILLKREIDFDLNLVGTGPETPRLKRLALDSGLTSRVHFVGYVDPLSDELPEYFRSADLLVHPSLEEGFGMVLAEAMASGLPIVAASSGAIPEVVGEAGILVPPRDPISLANAIQTVLTDPAVSKSIIAEGRSRAERMFGWDMVADETIRVYDEARKLKDRLV